MWLTTRDTRRTTLYAKRIAWSWPTKGLSCWICRSHLTLLCVSPTHTIGRSSQRKTSRTSWNWFVNASLIPSSPRSHLWLITGEERLPNNINTTVNSCVYCVGATTSPSSVGSCTTPRRYLRYTAVLRQNGRHVLPRSRERLRQLWGSTLVSPRGIKKECRNAHQF